MLSRYSVSRLDELIMFLKLVGSSSRSLQGRICAEEPSDKETLFVMLHVRWWGLGMTDRTGKSSDAVWMAVLKWCQMAVHFRALVVNHFTVSSSASHSRSKWREIILWLIIHQRCDCWSVWCHTTLAELSCLVWCYEIIFGHASLCPCDFFISVSLVLCVDTFIKCETPLQLYHQIYIFCWACLQYMEQSAMWHCWLL